MDNTSYLADKTNQATPDRFIRRPEVCEITSLPTSTLTYLVKNGDFPKPYKLSERMSAWKLSEVMAWVNSRVQAGEVA